MRTGIRTLEAQIDEKNKNIEAQEYVLVFIKRRVSDKLLLEGGWASKMGSTQIGTFKNFQKSGNNW